MMTNPIAIFVLAAFSLAANRPAAESLEPPIRNAQLHRLGASSNLEADLAALMDRLGPPAWAGYAVPGVAGSRSTCCGDCGWRGVCRLEEGHNSYESSDEDELQVTDTILVLYRIERDHIDKIRTFSSDCELDAEGMPVYWWSDVDPQQSLSLLEKQVATPGSTGTGEKAVQSIALHRDPRAATLLEAFATGAASPDVAEKAIFWMGAARGRAGLESLRRVKREVRDEDLREQITFALYISKAPGSTTELIDMARHDPNRHTRGKALFWLGQRAGRRAVETIKEAVEKDPDLEIKKKAVFALSQLPSDEGVPLLIEVARNHRHPEVRKKAMFWLGQSGDPRALDFFEQVLLNK